MMGLGMEEKSARKTLLSCRKLAWALQRASRRNSFHPTGCDALISRVEGLETLSILVWKG
jgi:hypothetical protein